MSTREVRVALPGRITYVTGTVNGMTYPFTATEDGRWGAVVDRANPDIYEVELTVIADNGATGTYRTTLYYGLHLITDRTNQDVLSRTPKGYYNATDLNRVGAAVLYVAQRLDECGYHVDVNVKTDWMLQDFPTVSAMTQYLDNVAALRAALATLPTTPPTPPDMEKLWWWEANDIERILEDVDRLITNMIAAYYYVGELYAGEVTA